MQSAPLPENEEERLKKVIELGILDTEPEERFDAITRDAIKAFDVPISTITIMDSNREWYKSCQGVDVKEMPREVSFCAHAMLAKDTFIVEDTLLDDRFKDNPMVTGKPYIRFYAGVALKKDGLTVGVFCIKDTKPRKLTVEDVARLIVFAERAEAELNKKNA
ncbi:MAG: GAF domain-containing protein [Candidatus Paceibacterota bacterium]|jgi:GAF domain-containing protein